MALSAAARRLLPFCWRRNYAQTSKLSREEQIVEREHRIQEEYGKGEAIDEQEARMHRLSWALMLGAAAGLSWTELRRAEEVAVES
jgi:hypothetical protein